MNMVKAFFKRGFIAAVVVLFIVGLTGQTRAEQTPLPGALIPQFVDPLPVLDISSGGTIKTIVAGTGEIELHMREFKANMMPSTFVPASGTYTGTWVFGYIEGPNAPTTALDTYTGPVIVATRDVPTQVRYVNNLGNTATTNVPLWQEDIEVGATDQTIHWADPLNDSMNLCNHTEVNGESPEGDCEEHYSGPIPAVPHLHGGEVPPVLDGGPDAWFTSDGIYHGPSYYTYHPATDANNESVYRYPNVQEAAPLWFHDHLLGGTRINVYCGLAGAYVLTDPALKLPVGLSATGLQQGKDGAAAPLIPLVIQDRMFDVDGQLYFPNEGINPNHPFWIPEFMGDTICVNGKVWPYLSVKAKRYRFLIINGSNARTYELSVNNEASGEAGPSIWQIGTDGGYLDKPAHVTRLLIQPGERADIIIDFAGYEGQKLLLANTGATPYPFGDGVDPETTGSVMEFRVQPGTVTDKSFNPMSKWSSLLGWGRIPTSGKALRKPMVRLVNTSDGTLARGVTVDKTRQLTLNEVEGGGGPGEVLINNTRWEGKRQDGSVPTGFTPITLNGMTSYYSELPNEGDTEVWEIVNLTADAHPIHTHLTQFQLINRQHFDTDEDDGYPAAYAAAFPGGAWITEYGPPLDYATGNTHALGGNPDVTPYLQGDPIPPPTNEAGWKDTIMMRPGMVTRIAVRYASQNKPLNSKSLFFDFDPFALSHGYVWHCHIVEHEDNEMMRPLAVVPKDVTRTYVQGVDY